MSHGFASLMPKTYEGRRIWHRETQRLEITEAICGRMIDIGMSRKILANRMGITVKKLNTILGTGVMSLPMLIRFAWEMAGDLKLTIVPEAKSTAAHEAGEG